MRLAGPVCLSYPECGLCWSRRLEGRRAGWLPYADDEARRGILGELEQAAGSQVAAASRSATSR